MPTDSQNCTKTTIRELETGTNRYKQQNKKEQPKGEYHRSVFGLFKRLSPLVIDKYKEKKGKVWGGWIQEIQKITTKICP